MDRMELLKDIYKKDIQKRYFTGIKESSDPTAVFLGGQPGAGKSTVTELTVRSMEPNSTISVDMDELRKYHPDYEKTIQSGGDLYSLDADTREFKKMLLEDAFDKKVNIVFDGTLGGTTEYIQKEMEQCHNNGFKVQLNVLATNEFVSKLGFVSRYENQVAKEGFGRNVDLGYHNQIYANLTTNIQKLCTTGVVNRVEVYGRDHVTSLTRIQNVFTPQGNNEQNINAFTNRVLNSFIKERQRSFSKGEEVKLSTWYEKVKTQATNRGVKIDEFNNTFKINDTTINKSLAKQIENIKGLGLDNNQQKMSR